MGIANNKINWLNIITNHDFQIYLDLNLIKDISSVSKLFREKLMPLLFDYIVFAPSYIMKFNIKNNIFCEYFSYDQYGGSRYTVSSKVKGFSIDSGLECLDMDFNNFKQFIKRLHIVNVNRAGYYLLPLLNNFCNLTELNLYSCFIPYSGFFKLGECSPNLKQIELRLVVLIKLATDRVPIGDIVLPPNLRYLRVFICSIIEKVSIRDPYKFLFEHISQLPKRNFVLPKITVPSLKSLVYIDNNIQDSGLKDFLELNPNIESLKLKSFDYILDDSCSSIKRLEINDLCSFNTYSNTSALSSITILIIANARMDHFDNISSLKTFCNKFPNLEELDLKPNYYKSFQVLADKFLTQFIYNLPKLKTLKLNILLGWSKLSFSYIDDAVFDFRNSTDDKFDITNFNTIENFYLKADGAVILNTNFEKCTSLKQVLFYTESDILNSEEFMQKFNGYKDWTFKFSLHTIKGNKISK